MKKGLFSLCMAVSLFPAVVNAQAFDNYYFGISAGKAELDANASSIHNDIKSEGFYDITIDDSDTAFKIFGGAEINDNLSLEAFYTNLGQYTVNADFTKQNITANTDIRYDIESVGIDLVGSFPLSETFNIFGKIGMQYWYVDSIVDVSSNTSAYYIKHQSDLETGFDPTYGIGIAMNIHQFSVRAEYEVYKIDEEDINMMSVGVAYHF